MSDSFNTACAPWKLSVSFLKEFTVVLHTPDGSSRRVPISPNAKRIQLLAYLAWRRGQRVSRREILDRLFLPDLVAEKGTSKKEFMRLWRSSEEEKRRLSREVGTKFEAHKKLVRRDIRAAVAQFNTERGTNLLPANIDPFEQAHQLWWLSSLWHVADLERVEEHTRVIREAEKQGKLMNTVPESVKAACDALLAAYPGDFLEEMLRMYPEEFRPLKTSWVREPYTLYRGYYLQALWYAGEYEWHRGEAGADGQPWEHYERAAELFRRYAIYACNNRLDTEVSFHTEKYGVGVRVLMSEKAMCRSLVVYQARGRRQDFEECKQTYAQQMEQISSGIWKPGKQLQEIVQSVNW
jgi:hypothetical protein